jgi:transketolase
LSKNSSENQLKETALEIRKVMIDMGYNCGTSAHFGGGLSMVEILTTLYSNILNYDIQNTSWDDRDRFILSKGHGVLGFYASLYVFGLIGKNELASFQQDESEFIAHPIMDLKYGIESSNGSLGHGLSLGVGVAMAAKLKKKDFKVYVMLGDGECNEGSVWEAVMCAYHHNLDNLVAIVDRNSMQNDGESKDVMSFFSLEKAWEGFGWNVISVDGHNFNELEKGLLLKDDLTKPTVLIANTIKGKGISFMENVPSWHHGKLTENTYNEAINELSGKAIK